jgi:hypothetical protein
LGANSNQKSQFWVNFGGSCNGRCWYIDDHFVHFTVIWYILWPFGIFYVFLVYFFHFGMMYQEKSGNPSLDQGDQFGRIFRLLDNRFLWIFKCKLQECTQNLGYFYSEIVM